MAGYATVAGAVLTGVGALTGKKDLMKIGSVLTLAGGVGTLANGASGATSSAASATGGGEAVDQLTAEYAANNASGAASQTASASASGAASVSPIASQSAGSVPLSAPVFDPSAPAAPSLFDIAKMAQSNAAPPVTTGMPDNLVDTGFAAQQAGGASQLSAAGAPQVSSVPATAPTLSPLQQGAQGLTQGDVQSYLDRTAGSSQTPSLWDRVSGAGKWIQDNPNAARLLGQVIPGAIAGYGQARQEDMLQRQQDYQQSLMERARANLNSPIRIAYGGRK